MYKLSGNLKLFSIIIAALGLIGIVYSFISVPSTVDDVKGIVAEQQAIGNAETAHGGNEGQLNFIDKIHHPGFTESVEKSTEQAHGAEHESKVEHALHQLQLRPWTSLFIAAFFFFMIALGALVFHAAQHVSEAGWSPVLFRVIHGVTSYLLPGSIVVVLIIFLAGTRFYPWQDESLVAHDSILQMKSLYLNMPLFIIRAIIYLLIWNVYRFWEKRNSLNQVDPMDFRLSHKNHSISTYFIVFFAITEATMGIDWFMSMTPHWYSTLYSWYIFASLFVSGITAITLVVIYLKKLGHLEFVNDSHIHDLGEYIFAFSIFWTYLWFAQFMLIWYANIPEEASHFVMRVQHYPLWFFGMLVFNFAFPILILMNSDFKRKVWIVGFVGICLLAGHYIDVYMWVVPSVLGPYGSFGIPEIAGILFFLGVFILIVGTSLGKRSLYPKGDPYLKESENYHL